MQSRRSAAPNSDEKKALSSTGAAGRDTATRHHSPQHTCPRAPTHKAAPAQQLIRTRHEMTKVPGVASDTRHTNVVAASSCSRASTTARDTSSPATMLGSWQSQMTRMRCRTRKTRRTRSTKATKAAGGSAWRAGPKPAMLRSACTSAGVSGMRRVITRSMLRHRGPRLCTSLACGATAATATCLKVASGSTMPLTRYACN